MVNLSRISKGIAGSIESDLIRCGLFYRVFNRTKSKDSIKEKIKYKGYTPSGKMLQDSIGLRVTLYFRDDIELFVAYLKKKFDTVGETIDKPGVDEFSANRINLVFRIPDYCLEEFHSLTNSYPAIDTTFEVQVRTMLSEGWHEVEHDLRYKCKKDWDERKDLSRTLNGIYASLETSDWSMLKIFDEMSYGFYKKQEINSMLRHKLRIRFSDDEISDDIKTIVNTDNAILKGLFRIDRKQFISKILNNPIDLPLTMDNIIYTANIMNLKNEDLRKITPAPIMNELSPYL